MFNLAEMIFGIMLIGAWLLVHQCCAVTQTEKSRSIVDQLSRRSSLEKNFMRFGRSLELSQNHHSIPSKVKRSKEMPLFMRLGKAQGDFMRFGRAPPSANFMRFGKSKQNFMRFGRDAGYGKGIMRAERAKENFMRFGRESSGNRSFGWLEQDENLAIDNKNNIFERAERAKDNFMRFGRLSEYPIKEEGFNVDDNLASTGADQERDRRAKDTTFIRFGREGNERRAKDAAFIRFGRVPKLLRNRRGKGSSFMRFGRGYNEEFGRDERAKDSAFIRFGRDQMGKFWRDERGKDFIRFGRSQKVGSGENDSFGRNARGKSSGFIRFGRDEKDSTGIGDAFLADAPLQDESGKTTMGREVRGKSSFIRFGRDTGEGAKDQRAKPDIYNPTKSGLESFMRLGRALPSPFQPGFILGSELALLPPLPVQPPKGHQPNMRIG